jgi:hypothetical protein
LSLTWGLSRVNNLLIPRIEGKWHCSSVDPLSEAQKWQKKMVIQDQQVKQCIVLGAGGGYHLRELVEKTRAQVLCIDFNRALIEHLRDQSLGLDLHCLDSIEAKNWGHQEVLIQAVQNSYCVLEFGPSTIANKSSYQNLKDFLNGRSQEGLTFLSRARKLELKANNTEPLISLKSLITEESTQNSQFAILKELIR